MALAALADLRSDDADRSIEKLLTPAGLAEGRAAFARFESDIAADLHAPMPQRLDLLKTALQTALNEDVLINLEAREAFEAHLVLLLTSGWRTGHETLFDAAVYVMQWEECRGCLEELGDAGDTIQWAMDEHAMLFYERDLDVRRYHRIMTRLRLGRDPDAELLQLEMPHLQKLATRFPNYLTIAADQHAVKRWYDAYHKITGGRPPPRAQARDGLIYPPSSQPQQAPLPMNDGIANILRVLSLLAMGVYAIHRYL